MTGDVIGLSLNIIVVDLTLSITNALAIGLFASQAPARYRTVLALGGYFGAAGFRILVASIVTEVQSLSTAQFIINFLLLIVSVDFLISAIRDLWPQREQEYRYLSQQKKRTLVASVLGVALTDLVDSTDNILAVAHLAAGDVLAITIGLAVSIGVVFLTGTVLSEFVRRLLEWIPILIDTNCVFVAWVSANLIVGDPLVVAQFHLNSDQSLLLHIVCVQTVLVADVILRLVRRRQAKHAKESAAAAPASVD